MAEVAEADIEFRLIITFISVKNFQFIYLLGTTLRKSQKPDLLGPSQYIVR